MQKLFFWFIFVYVVTPTVELKISFDKTARTTTSSPAQVDLPRESRDNQGLSIQAANTSNQELQGELLQNSGFLVLLADNAVTQSVSSPTSAGSEETKPLAIHIGTMHSRRLLRREQDDKDAKDTYLAKVIGGVLGTALAITVIVIIAMFWCHRCHRLRMPGVRARGRRPFSQRITPQIFHRRDPVIGHFPVHKDADVEEGSDSPVISVWSPRRVPRIITGIRSELPPPPNNSHLPSVRGPTASAYSSGSSRRDTATTLSVAEVQRAVKVMISRASASPVFIKTRRGFHLAGSDVDRILPEVPSLPPPLNVVKKTSGTKEGEVVRCRLSVIDPPLEICRDMGASGSGTL